MGPTLRDARLFAAAYGVTEESLRLYEARGLLRPVSIDGIRYYTPQDGVRFQIILKGKQLGFSLAEIEKLLLGTEWRPADASESRQPDVDRVTAEVQTLEGRRDRLDASIVALKAKLDGR